MDGIFEITDFQPDENDIRKINFIVKSYTGFDFSYFKVNTIKRRIERRMMLTGKSSLREYISFLNNNPNEAKKIFEDFLIGVTSFFRDEQVFSYLEDEIIKKIVSSKSENDDLRVWVPACSTGEEAFTIAIIIDKTLKALNKSLNVMIFATDLSRKSIDKARRGVYSDDILADMHKDKLCYFIHEGKTLRLTEEIRSMVSFSLHNLIEDPPITNIDLISCRNLLIYMEANIQKRIMPLFHYSLARNGYLLLGTAENVGLLSHLFSEVSNKHRIYKKNEMPNPYKVKDNFIDIEIEPIDDKILYKQKKPYSEITFHPDLHQNAYIDKNGKNRIKYRLNLEISYENLKNRYEDLRSKYEEIATINTSLREENLQLKGMVNLLINNRNKSKG